MRYSFAPFLAVGITFVVLGINGQRTLLYIGIAFIVFGLVLAQKLKNR